MAELKLLPKAFPTGVSVGAPSVAVATLGELEVWSRALEVCRVVGTVVVNEVGLTAQSDSGHDVVIAGGAPTMTVVMPSSWGMATAKEKRTVVRVRTN